MDRGLAVEDVEARRRDAAGAERLDQGRVLDEVAARDIDDNRSGREARERAGIQEASGLRRGGRREDQEIADFQEAAGGGVEGGAVLDVEPATVVVVYIHVEAALRPPGDAAADPAHAEDADAASGHVAAEKLRRRPATPFAAVEQHRPLVGTPGRAEQQQHSHLGHGVAEDVGSAQHRDTPVAGRREVDVVVADRQRREGAHPLRQRSDRRPVQPVGRRDQEHVGLERTGDGDDALRTERPVVGIEPSPAVDRKAPGERVGQLAGHRQPPRLRLLVGRHASPLLGLHILAAACRSCS